MSVLQVVKGLVKELHSINFPEGRAAYMQVIVHLVYLLCILHYVQKK